MEIKAEIINSMPKENIHTKFIEHDSITIINHIGSSLSDNFYHY